LFIIVVIIIIPPENAVRYAFSLVSGYGCVSIPLKTLTEKLHVCFADTSSRCLDNNPVKISSPNDLYCVEWDVKPYSTQLKKSRSRSLGQGRPYVSKRCDIQVN